MVSAYFTSTHFTATAMYNFYEYAFFVSAETRSTTDITDSTNAADSCKRTTPSSLARTIGRAPFR